MLSKIDLSEVVKELEQKYHLSLYPELAEGLFKYYKGDYISMLENLNLAENVYIKNFPESDPNAFISFLNNQCLGS